MITHSIIQKSQLEGAHRIDAEYFSPEYLEIEQKVFSAPLYKLWKDIDGRFISGPFGSEFTVDNYVLNSGYRYVRGRDIKDFFLMDDDNVYIPEKDYERLKKYTLKGGDVLISVVGTLGNAVIVDGSVSPAIFSCKSTVFRTNKINPYYLITYLNSRFGRALLARCVRGAVQTGLNIDDLKSLPIVIPSEKQQEDIASIVAEAKTRHCSSKSFYTQAEDLLLQELGLKNFKSQDDLSYSVKLSDIKLANRMDADYFQPKYDAVIVRIKKYNLKPLAELVTMKKGFEPGSDKYQEDGKVFLRVSNISKFGFTVKDQKYLSNGLYQQLKGGFEPKIGDILLTKDATPGIAYVLKESIEGIIASGIMRLKIKEDIDAEYLALCINSLVCQMQVERDAGGSIIVHWKPEQIKKLQIPILSKNMQQKIADLVRNSYQARKKAKELLGEAKQKVEELIEKE